MWTPENLTESDLYALWVRRDGAEQQWAISPPWKVEEVRYRNPLSELLLTRLRRRKASTGPTPSGSPSSSSSASISSL